MPNPYHDPANGQFTSGPSGAKVAAAEKLRQLRVSGSGGVSTSSVADPASGQTESSVPADLSKLPRKEKTTERTAESALDDALVCNPSWTPKGDKYGNVHYRDNCTHCVVAYELRRQGYDVEAMPTRVGNRGRGQSTDDDILSNFRYPGAETRPTMRALPPSDDSAETLQSVLMEHPDGSRGWVSVEWKTGGGHIFAWERAGDQVVYTEPQDPENRKQRDIADTLNRTKGKDGMKKVEYIRSDKLVPDESVISGDRRMVRTRAEGEAERAKASKRKERAIAKHRAAAAEALKRAPKAQTILDQADGSGHKANRGEFALGVVDAQRRTRDQMTNKALSLALGGNPKGSAAYWAGVTWYNEQWKPAHP